MEIEHYKLRVMWVGLSLSIVGVDRLDEVTRQQVLRFFFTHVDWLRRFPSLHSSANNHRIAELSGIIVATTMAPGILGGETLREASWHDLLAELDRFGWVSPSFGVLLPTSCLLFQGKLEQPSVIIINLLSETQAQH